MPRRKSLTKRILQHLLLLSLARAILTVSGRGRAWDEWDEQRYEDPQPAAKRSFQRRFAQTLSFSALFFAGLAISAGAGNTVRALLDDESATSQAQTGATGTTGATGVLEREALAQTAVKTAQAKVAVPTAPASAQRTAVVSTRVTPSLATERTATPKATAAAPTRVTRTAKAGARTQQRANGKAPASKRTHRHTAPKAPPALDPEVQSAESSVVWINRAGVDPTPESASLKVQFARRLVTFSRQAKVDWALVLATLRAEGHNGRTPAGSMALRRLAFRLGSLGGRNNAWAAALAYSSDTALADRVVALRHYYRAVGLPALVHGLLSQKADLEDRVLHDSRLHIYAGGRSDVANGHVDVRVLALMLYLGQTYHEVTVSCLFSGHRLYARPGVVSAHIYGRAVDIAALGNTSITGHQQPGGLTEQAVRSILMLPGGMLPAQVISLLGLGGPSFPLANHYDHIHVGY
jgi:hypothetical protein